MRIYLDNCCYNRPFDDRTNIKNYLEREAVLLILQLVYEGALELVGGEVVQKEIRVIRHPLRRERVQDIYYSFDKKEIKLTQSIIREAKRLADIINTKPFDSLHIASAEGNADVFLTTDIRLIKACKRIALPYKVMNPIEFVMEVTEND